MLEQLTIHRGNATLTSLVVSDEPKKIGANAFEGTGIQTHRFSITLIEGIVGQISCDPDCMLAKH